jgi:hypothetical protein
LAYSYDSGYDFMDAKPPCVIANVTLALDYRDLIPRFADMTIVELTLSRRDTIGGAFLSQAYTMKRLKLRVAGVSCIGKAFLKNCVALEEVDWADCFANVVSIGAFFMEGCVSLKSIDFSQVRCVQTLNTPGFLSGCTALAGAVDLSPLRYAIHQSGYHSSDQKHNWMNDNANLKARRRRLARAGSKAATVKPRPGTALRYSVDHPHLVACPHCGQFNTPPEDDAADSLVRCLALQGKICVGGARTEEKRRCNRTFVPIFQMQQRTLGGEVDGNLGGALTFLKTASKLLQAAQFHLVDVVNLLYESNDHLRACPTWASSSTHVTVQVLCSGRVVITWCPRLSRIIN